MIRKIGKTITGIRTQDGAGVKLTRVIGIKDVYDVDPFLMLDAFDSTDPEDYVKGFPWHPHRGIETVTYLIRGEIEHGDSIGNKGSILDGCCQWMTAGGGIMHQEMPKPSEKMLGVQLWLNLPAKNKFAPPQYRDITADLIPKTKKDGVTVAIISGQYEETKGPVTGDYVPLTFLDVEMEAGTSFEIATPAEETLFVYVVSGEGFFDEAKESSVEEKCAILFKEGSKMIVEASQKGMRFLLFLAKPLKEPIAWGGPIVMNTKEELNKAFEDLEKGTFIQTNIIK
jgi:hypothetical protein